MISIIMPTFNQDAYIKYSIDSILNQTSVDFELIVVPVLEDKKTIRVLNCYSDSRIKVVYSNYALITHQMNVGYYNVSDKSDYIMLFASDDFMVKDNLKKIYDYALQKNAVVVYPNYYFADKNLKIIKPFNAGNHSHENLVKNCYITDVSLVKKSVFFKYIPMGFLDGHDRIWKIWRNISAEYSEYFFNYKDPLFLYRQHGKNVHLRQKSQGQYEPLVIGYNDRLESFYKTIHRSGKIEFFNPTIYFPDPLAFLNFDYEKLKYKRLIIHWTEKYLETIPKFLSYRNLYHISNDKKIIYLLLASGLSNVVFISDEKDFLDFIYKERYTT